MFHQSDVAEFNPYLAPRAQLTVASNRDLATMVLAGRWIRLGASLIDFLILAVPAVAILGLAYVIYGYAFWRPVTGTDGLLRRAGLEIFSCAMYLVVNIRWLLRDGQTIGKKLCGIRIAKLDGTRPTLRDSFFLRTALPSIIQQIPYVGLLIFVDVLFIFRKNRRCLHDLIAGTIVVNADFSSSRTHHATGFATIDNPQLDSIEISNA